MENKSPIVEIAKKVCPAVITIVISKDLPKVDGYYFFPFGGQQYVVPKFDKEKEKTKVGGGSGFVVSPDGYIITSNHVVADPEADYTIILSPTEKCPAKIMSRDPISDIAILKIDCKNLAYLELGDSDQVELGEEVVAIGNALGEFHDTVSAGIISGMSRAITAFSGLDSQSSQLRGLFQTDAAINPGNSGGPLVNMQGKAIGINTATVMGAQNIGFAIPINYIKKDLEEVMKYGKVKRPFLGVRYILISKELAKMHKLPIEYGALIVRETLGEEAVVKNSAADKSGLKEYDIIIEVNKEKVDDKNPLANLLQKYQIDEELSFKVLRGSKELELKVRMEEKK